MIKELGTIHLGGLEEHRQPILDTDVDGYLEQQNTETLMKIMNNGRKEVNIYSTIIINVSNYDSSIDHEGYK